VSKFVSNLLKREQICEQMLNREHLLKVSKMLTTRAVLSKMLSDILQCPSDAGMVFKRCRFFVFVSPGETINILIVLHFLVFTVCSSNVQHQQYEQSRYYQ
jgi:hypothetical protein